MSFNAEAQIVRELGKFLKFIRVEKKFKNAKQLQSQIKSDLKIAKKAS